MEAAAKLDPQAWMTAPATTAVIAALTAGGATVRFVGGCVRDTVIGRPVSDIDIATPDPPERVVTLLEAAGLRAVPTGFAHGTITAVAHKTPFEVTTLRRDVETDGRHATVAFTDDWRIDAARRDFTMNAMFCDADGTLYDPFDGRADLDAGCVRFVGDAGQRIDEDALRLLRFFRFHAHYGRPPPDPAALTACRAKAPALSGLSGERVSSELLKLLAAPAPAEVIALMIETGVLSQVLPEVTGADGLAALCDIEGDAADPIRRLALLLRRGSGGAAAVAGRLKLSNARRDRLAALVEPPANVVAGLDVKAQRRLLHDIGAALFADLTVLAWADAASHEPGAARDGELFGRVYRAMLETAAAWEAPRLPVKGADAVKLGVPPGPRVGELLAAVEAWWIDADFRPGRKAALKKLRDLARDRT